MREWEYIRLDLNNTPRRGDDIEVLNRAGSEGWELVAVTGNGVAYLKREIAGQQGLAGAKRLGPHLASDL
jgi:hypothetical protein